MLQIHEKERESTWVISNYYIILFLQVTEKNFEMLVIRS